MSIPLRMTTVSAGTGPMNLVLYPAGTFGCPGASLSAPRAFHTVLPLPTGELLVAGGLTGFGKGDAEKFQLVSGVEIFDPKLNAFYPLAEERGRVPRGRAFHRAAVLDQQNGLVRVLLYGGIADSPGKPTIVANGARAGEILRLAPTDPAQMISNSELLVIDVANRQVQRPALTSADSFTPAAFAGGAPLPGGGLLAAGGHFRPNPDTTLSAVTGYTVVPPQPQSAAPTPLVTKSLDVWLLGPSVTVFGDGQALIYGLAHAQPGKGDATRTVAAQVSGLRQLVSLRFFEPYFLDSDWSTSAELFSQLYVFPDFSRTSRGGSLTFGYALIDPRVEVA